jgi:hypothetical protein
VARESAILGFRERFREREIHLPTLVLVSQGVPKVFSEMCVAISALPANPKPSCIERQSKKRHLRFSVWPLSSAATAAALYEPLPVMVFWAMLLLLSLARSSHRSPIGERMEAPAHQARQSRLSSTGDRRPDSRKESCGGWHGDCTMHEDPDVAQPLSKRRRVGTNTNNQRWPTE